MDHKGGAHFPADGALGGIRNTMLTPESTDAICEIVRHGNYITTACRVLQIGIRTVTRWMSLGRQAVEEGREDMYSVFYLRVKEAEACAEIYAVEAWRSHLDRDWRACKDYLARRFPDRWADQRRVTIGVEREM